MAAARGWRSQAYWTGSQTTIFGASTGPRVLQPVLRGLWMYSVYWILGYGAYST